ncbi:MAG: hypothetical protein ACYC4Q_02250 [Victivallaceae bacterium]
MSINNVLLPISPHALPRYIDTQARESFVKVFNKEKPDFYKKINKIISSQGLKTVDRKPCSIPKNGEKWGI